MATAETEKPSSDQTIFNYYSVENEVDFIAKQRVLGSSETNLIFYLKNNVMRFLEEFAGKVKHSSINYFIENGRLYYPGVAKPVLDSYEKYSQEQGSASREEAETLGFEKIQKALTESEANTAFWISPPSFDKQGFGDYGFLFVFTKNGQEIIVRNLRYNNESRDFTKSFYIYDQLSMLSPSVDMQLNIADEKDFLKQPFFFSLLSPAETVAKICSHLGFNNDHNSDEFRKIIENDGLISNWLIDYINLMLEESGEEAKKYLQAIYNRAVSLTKKQEELLFQPTTLFIPNNDVADIYKHPQLFAYYLNQKPAVFGGGSCPAGTRQTDRSPFNTDIDIMLNRGGVLNYQSADKLNKSQESHFNCPACNAKIPSGRGIETCPNCGMTKQQWAQENKGCD